MQSNTNFTHKHLDRSMILLTRVATIQNYKHSDAEGRLHWLRHIPSEDYE